MNPLPSYEPLFSSSEAKAALERTIAFHFLRTGQFDTAETFLSVRTHEPGRTPYTHSLHVGIGNRYTFGGAGTICRLAPHHALPQKR